MPSMAVEIGGSYYRLKQEYKVTSLKINNLLYTITADFSTTKNGTPQLAEYRQFDVYLLEGVTSG